MSGTHQPDAGLPVHGPRRPSRLRRGLAVSVCGLVLAGVLAACTRAPIALIAQPADGQITLSWTPVSQLGCPTIDGYAVYQGTTPGGENYASPLNAQVTGGGPITTTLTAYTVTNLTDGVTYYFTVKTVGSYFGQPCTSWTSVEIAATPGTDDDFFGCWQDQLCIVTRHLPSGDRGRLYAANLYADDGTPPYTWSWIGGRLPGSVMLGPDGLLTGILGGHGLYVFYVQVEDSTGNTAAEELTIYVN